MVINGLRRDKSTSTIAREVPLVDAHGKFELNSRNGGVRRLKMRI